MKIFNFHLMPYRHADLDAIGKNGSAWVTFSNRHYDPQKGAELYHDYLDQMEFADQLGFDGVCLNEHHQTAYGMMPIPGVLAGALARSVKRAKLAILGRALPLLNNPLMIAEEYAMLDNLTRGRVIAGFVRGIGAEYHAMGINPAYSQERYAEAHDLIVRAWTEPGPFPYVGKHYQFKYVNPWPRPYQTPHPPIWIPSQGSGSTIRWAAQMRYTYCQTLSPIAAVARFFQMYRDEAEKAGYQASPDQLAWSNTIYVAETDEQGGAGSAPASGSADELLPQDAHRDAAAAGLHRRRVDETRAGGQGDRQAAIDRGRDQDRRRHRGKPQHRAREACRISGSRGLQHVADQDPVRHHAERHGAREHDGDRGGDPAAFPRSPAAGCVVGKRRSEFTSPEASLPPESQAPRRYGCPEFKPGHDESGAMSHGGP